MKKTLQLAEWYDEDGFATFAAADDVDLQELREALHDESLPEKMKLDILDMRFSFENLRERWAFAHGLEMGRILSA